jgi:hypothetical protein
VTETLAKPLWGVCKREVRIQNSGVRIIEALAKPLWGVLQERSQNTEDRSQKNRTRCP